MILRSPGEPKSKDKSPYKRQRGEDRHREGKVKGQSLE